MSIAYISGRDINKRRVALNSNDTDLLATRVVNKCAGNKSGDRSRSPKSKTNDSLLFSVFTCLIDVAGIYLTAVMAITSVSVIMTVIVLNFHYRGPIRKEMPRWLKKFLLDKVVEHHQRPHFYPSPASPRSSNQVRLDLFESSPQSSCRTFLRGSRCFDARQLVNRSLTELRRSKRPVPRNFA